VPTDTTSRCKVGTLRFATLRLNSTETLRHDDCIVPRCITVLRFLQPVSHQLRERKMKASSLSFPAATLLAIAGMTWGIVMAASGDHSAMPAHAHLNLLGWVSLFLFGIFYHLHPAVDRSRAAIVHGMDRRDRDPDHRRWSHLFGT
jgi:hypothetical protein